MREFSEQDKNRFLSGLLRPIKSDTIAEERIKIRNNLFPCLSNRAITKPIRTQSRSRKTTIEEGKKKSFTRGKSVRRKTKYL